ncbi:hypothetical protein [Metabacillus schmidteae]|uniref:hypothetical protein n=1 Tax=Metabacillus schmidteae TaxID=2730405 RepID=UPI00158AF3B4|nr:hypothetical protein [Metabacillus schmidteae]
MQNGILISQTIWFIMLVNRQGARKGSKSGIRGVSWDETNQDWIVSVKGTYYGRFKSIEKAKKLAEEKIKEQMPYINK